MTKLKSTLTAILAAFGRLFALPVRKGILFPLFAAAAVVLLAGCGGKTQPKPPGYYLEANRGEDFALTCDDIWLQSEEVKSSLKLYRERSESRRGEIRDYVARLRVLHRWGQKKGCDEQWGLGSFSPDQVAPAEQKSEKSRVIICSDDQSCVVE